MTERVVSVRLQAKVDGFTAGMRKAKASVDDLTKADLKKPSQAFSDIADKAAVMSVAVGAGLGVAVKRFADFDQAMSAVKANSGATGAELESLRAAAVKLGADSQFSAAEAAQGINELAKAGVSTTAVLNGGLKGALDLAAAGQIEVGQAAETTASAMTQFNLQGDQAVHVADLLTNGANKAQGGVLDLGQALQQAGLVAAGTGLSIEETTAGLTAFAAAGLTGSDAGTSFKTMLQRLSAPSGEAADLMAELGISAYDAQGNFVGLQSVAGQLQEGLQDLTPAQRDAALATIFGADAIRGARVLYQQGAQGIRDWTDAVSEQGAAARQAAELTDNLNGDIERLGGAFDSVFIQTGGSANGALRTLVQGLTGVVEYVGKIPGPLLLAGGALTGIAFGVPKAITSFKSFTSTLDSAGLSLEKIAARGPRAAKGIDLATRATKAFATAAATATVAYAVFDDKITSLGPNELAKDLRSGDEALAEINKRFAENAALSLRVDSGINDVASALSAAFNPSTAESVDRVIGSFKGIFGGTDVSNIAVANQRLAELDGTLAQLASGGDIEGAKASFQAIADVAERQGVSVEELLRKLPQYRDALAGVDNAQSAAADSGSTLTQATDDAKTSAEEASDAWDRLKSAIDGLGSPIAQQRAANRDFQASLRGVDDALDALRESYKQEALAKGKDEKAAEKWAEAQFQAAVKSGDALDITTEAGARVQAALDQIRQSTLDKVEADFQATGSTKAATDAMKEGREEFIRAAREAGYTKQQAKDLADQLGLIPRDVEILVKQSGAEAAGAQIAAAAVDRNSTIWVTSRFRTTDTSSEYRGVGGRAMGGAIHGPGSGTSDTAGIFALSNGEHVLTASDVKKLGGQSAVYALRAAVQQGWRPQGYATGGAVQYAPRVQVVMAGGGGGPQMTRQDFDQRINIERFYTTDERSFRLAAERRRAAGYSTNARAS